MSLSAVQNDQHHIILCTSVRSLIDARLKYALEHQRRTPCFPQIDLIFRAILYEQRPPFIVLFSHQTTSYSQIFFTHPIFVPAADIFVDFPSGCPNPCCTDDCEMIRFPRTGTGIDAAVVLPLKRGTCRGGCIRAHEMCNWVDCDIAFSEVLSPQPWLVSSTAAIVIHKVIQYHPCPPPTIIHHGILASCQI